MKYIENYQKRKIELNAENMYVVMDFDGTVTQYKHSDSWDVAGQELGEEFKKELVNLFDIYRPIELDYNISYEEKAKAMEEWYKKCIDLYYEYGLTQKKLDNSILGCELNFRDNAKEFFEYMYKNNIPVIILSAGIGNVIEGFLKNNNCYFDNIYIISNFIEFNENGNMNKFNGKIINSTNKKLDVNKIQNWKEKEKLEKRKYKLLLGDLIEDKNMVNPSEWDTTISIGFLEQGLENLPFFEKAFDIVLSKEDANYKNVLEILKFE